MTLNFFLIFGDMKFQIVADAFLKARYDILFVVDCCLKAGR